MPTIYSAKKSETKTTSTEAEKNMPVSRKLLHNIRKDLEKIKTSRFKSFHSFPSNIRFETQENKEQIILFLRKHFITNIPWIIISLIMFFLPLFLTPSSFLNFMPLRFQVFTFLLWYILILILLFEKFLSWYFNVYIITDERVIDVDFYSLIYKHISETKIDKIEDVTYTQGGFLQAFFDYGRVDIQTAGEVTEFEFDAVPHPAQVAKVLNQLILQEEQEKMKGGLVNMPTPEIFTTDLVTDIWHMAKYLYLLFFLLYALFAFIIVRQEKLMIQTIDGQMSPVIKIIGVAHLLFSILIFLLALIIL